VRRARSSQATGGGEGRGPGDQCRREARERAAAEAESRGGDGGGQRAQCEGDATEGVERGQRGGDQSQEERLRQGGGRGQVHRVPLVPGDEGGDGEFLMLEVGLALH
jgi:hypothetical protein